MKKITFFLTTAFFAFSAVAPANADSYQYSPYAGIDYTYSYLTARDFKPHYNVAGLHIGSDYGQYFGTELFFNKSNGSKRRVASGSIKTSYRSYGLDLMAYLPLGCYKRFALIGTLGAGEYVFKTTFAPSKHHNEYAHGMRFGGGIKYALNKNWHARFITRYVHFDRSKLYDYAMEYGASIEYHF